MYRRIYPDFVRVGENIMRDYPKNFRQDRTVDVTVSIKGGGSQYRSRSILIRVLGTPTIQNGTLALGKPLKAYQSP